MISWEPPQPQKMASELKRVVPRSKWPHFLQNLDIRRSFPKTYSILGIHRGLLNPTQSAIKNVRSMAETQSNCAVVANGLIKQFGRFAALRGLSGEFAAGKLYVILGDNGAGKTTLLRIIAGLSHPTRGSVSVVGSKNIKNVRAQIGYMAHPSLLYDEMSGMENLRYFAGLYEIAPQANRQDSTKLTDNRCREVITAVKLDPDLERPVGQYSQGMRQRMSLARALLNDPKLLLLDEPFSNVEAHSAKEMSGLLAELRDRGKTLFVVTHQPALQESLADEFVWMEAGKIVKRSPALHAGPQ